MTILSRRFASAIVAVIGGVAIQNAAFAQAPTVGPAGGVASTTAPSNGQGTPAGGTGTLSTTRVGPSGVAPAPMAASPGAEPAPMPAPRRRVRHRRPVRHHVAPRPSTEVGTQSQAGTNGSVPPATR